MKDSLHTNEAIFFQTKVCIWDFYASISVFGCSFNCGHLSRSIYYAITLVSKPI